jgi:very-short-patch-repair endonuclease
MDEIPENFEPLDNDEAISLERLFIEKWCGFMLKEIDDDLAKLPGLPLIDQLTLRARWLKYRNLIMDAYQSLDKYKTETGKWDLLIQTFGDQLQVPAHSLPLDVKQRLDWYKQRAASRYERSVKGDMNVHSIQSPIEQIFLMEWRFLEVDARYGVTLRPQHELTLEGRTLRIDFVVDFRDGKKIAIELDGHDFHERTKAQAEKDRARERTIVRHGYIIQRFTGSEIARNPRKCVDEVIDLITQTERRLKS